MIYRATDRNGATLFSSDAVEEVVAHHRNNVLSARVVDEANALIAYKGRHIAEEFVFDREYYEKKHARRRGWACSSNNRFFADVRSAEEAAR